MLHASLELHKIKLVLGKAKPFEKYRGNVVFQNGKNTNVAQTIRLVSPREWHVRIFHLQNENEIKFFCHRLLAFVRYINIKMCDQSDQNVLQKSQRKIKEKNNDSDWERQGKWKEENKIESSQFSKQQLQWHTSFEFARVWDGWRNSEWGGKIDLCIVRCFGVSEWWTCRFWENSNRFAVKPRVTTAGGKLCEFERKINCRKKCVEKQNLLFRTFAHSFVKLWGFPRYVLSLSVPLSFSFSLFPTDT